MEEHPIHKAELVFVPAPGIGHLVSTIEFAQRLINRDPQRLSATILNIQVPSTPVVGSYVQSRAASSTSGIRFIDLPSVELPSPDLFHSPEAFISLHIQKHKPHVKRALTNYSVPLAGLVVDMFCTPLIDVAKELAIPSYIFFTSPAGFLGFMLHLPTLDLQITTAEFQDSGTELVIPSFVNSVHPLLLPTALLKREQDGYYWFLYHARRFRESEGIIVNTFQELEPHALGSLSVSVGGDVPPVYPVGPVIDFTGPSAKPDSDRAQNKEKIMKWLDHQPPSSVIFLCFGSMGGLSEAQAGEIARGLERTGYRFLWSLRQPPKIKTEHHPRDYTNLEQVLPDGFMERTAEMGLVCGWVPQVAVLAHKAVAGFVSHCGWNSIMESLWYGVPIATWPIYGEQHMNAFEMVRELELAVEIRLDNRNGGGLVLAEEIERGLRRLMMDDGELRRKVKEMGEKSRKAVEENGSSYTSLGDLIMKLLGNSV